MLYYCGIGSRRTPTEVCDRMTLIASRLEKLNFILRSGGAKGADSAFETGVKDSKNKKIYYAADALKHPWTFDLVQNYLPSDRTGFENWKPYIKKLLARNMLQVLGETNEPVRFVICWTPTLNYSTSECGGTGYALRLAEDVGIKIFNFKDPAQEESLNNTLLYLEK